MEKNRRTAPRKKVWVKLLPVLTLVLPLVSTGCQESGDPEIDQAVTSSYSLLSKAIEQRELALTDLREHQALDAGTELLESLARKQKAEETSPPPTEAKEKRTVSEDKGKKGTVSPGKPVQPAWERPAEESLPDLLKLREELALRGSVDSYRASAEVNWELETLRELSKRLTFQEGFPPENEFRLLAPETLFFFIERGTTEKQYLERWVAMNP